MIKISFKEDIEKTAIRTLQSLISSVTTKKEMHQKAADVIKAGVKENYSNAFEKVVDPNSSWQGLKAGLGLEAKPGIFTGSTLNSIVAEASEAIGEVMLKGKWPENSDIGKGINVNDLNKMFSITPSGVNINYRDDSKGIRVKDLFIPAEDFESKRFGSWIDEDINFMDITPQTKADAVSVIQAHLNRQIEKIIKGLTK